MPSLLSFILLDGYSLCAVLLLGGFWLLPGHRALFGQLLFLANTLLLGGATLLLLLRAWELYWLLPFKNDMEAFAFSNRLAGPYWFMWWAALTWQGLLPQLFWRLRRRRSLTLTAVIAAGLLVVGYVTLPPNQDYLPTSWGMLPNYRGQLLATGVFMLLLAAGWLVSARLRARSLGRTPHDAGSTTGPERY